MTHGNGVIMEGTGAAILVESMCDAGITTIFGVPGDTGVGFYDALYAASDRIRHVLARDERHAATMADVYARCTNQIGVVEASSGGGVSYVVGGLGEPFASSVPLLVITSDIHRNSRETGALTEMDQDLLFSAVTKWRAVATSAAEIPRLLTDAIAAATSGRPGPVSLILPENVLDEHARVTIYPTAVTIPRTRPSADNEEIARAVDALRNASRPAIVAGSGVHLSAAWAELTALAEQCDIPVATTIHGKGAIAETDPWSLGVAGANGAREYTNEYLAAADVVLLLGTRANATDTNSYQSPPRAGVTIIQNDIAGDRAGRNFPGSIPLIGDTKVVLQQLHTALVTNDVAQRHHLRQWIADHRQDWQLSTQDTPIMDSAMLNPRDVIRTIWNLVGGETIIIADPGTPTPYVAAYWETTVAARTIIIPRGHGPMGYAIPGAIGAAFAFPGRPIVALTGDGSFAMACGELETASRFNLPIIFVQFTNGSLGWIKMLQHLYTSQRYFGVDPGPIDAVAVARGMGVDAMRPTTLDHFAEMFQESLNLKKPVYIDVCVPHQIELVPPVAPWEATLAGKGGRPVY